VGNMLNDATGSECDLQATRQHRQDQWLWELHKHIERTHNIASDTKMTANMPISIRMCRNGSKMQNSPIDAEK